MIVTGILSLLMLLFSLLLSHAFDPIIYRSLDPSIIRPTFYPFTLPFILQSTACVICACFAIFSRHRRLFFWITVALNGLLILAHHYAMSRWPGGDDGPGLAWLLILKPVVIISGIISVIWGLLVVILKKKKSEPAGGAYFLPGAGKKSAHP